jgi:flagellar biosynthesis protein FlhB
MQIITLQGTGSVAVVNMNQAIDFISTILENNAEVSSELQKLENQIIQESTQITRAGLEEIIEWIIQIVLFVVILFALFYTIDLIFQVYFFAL